MKKVASIVGTIIVAIILILITLNLITMKHLQTEIVLNASKEIVWKTLIEVNNYEQWNPFIVSSKGTPAIGQQLTNKMMNNDKATVFTPIVTKVEEFREFEWLGSVLLGMFKGRHYFILEDVGNGQTKLIHGEHFSGLLSGLLIKMIGEDTLQNFQMMNKALQAQVERNSMGYEKSRYKKVGLSSFEIIKDDTF